MARRRSRRADWSEKQWFTISAPEEFGEEEVGETVAAERDDLVDRTVEVTYGDLSGDMSKQNTKIELQIDEVAGDRARTKFIGHDLTSDYVGSLVKRGTSRIDVTVDVLTEDGYKVRVKPVLFTTRQCRDSHKSDLRAETRSVVEEMAASTKFEEFVTSMVDGTMASEIYAAGREVYPLRRSEIRKSEVEAEPGEVEDVPEGFEEVAEEAGLAV